MHDSFNSLSNIAALLGHRKKDVAKKDVSHFSFDSRDIQRGTLFFALKGEKTDGHLFLKEVAAKGALGAVVSKEYRGQNYGLSIIPVQNVKSALQQLAIESYKACPTRIIGVTGTVGKTTTKEMIATLLSEKYKVYKSPGTANSQVSFPLNLLNRNKESDILVLEMGMSIPGELTKLVAIAPPQIGVITQISLVHAQNFLNLEEIAQAKAELFSSSFTELAILHHETASFYPITKLSCPKLFYRLDGKEEAYTGKCIKKGLVVKEKREKEISLSLPFLESHFTENFLAAVAVARYYKLSWEDIQRGALKISFQSHRFQRIEKKDILFIDDSYNSSPAGVEAALKNLPKPKKGRKKVAVFGPMKELGIFSNRCHKEIGEFALKWVDVLLCYGEECKLMAEAFLKGHKPAKWFASREEMVIHLISRIDPGDVVLIKGSNSLRMWEILNNF